MAICEFLVAILGLTVSTSNPAGQQAMVAFVCIYLGAFAASWVCLQTSQLLNYSELHLF